MNDETTIDSVTIVVPQADVQSPDGRLSHVAAQLVDASREARANFIGREIQVVYPAFKEMVQRAHSLARAPVRTRSQGLVISAASSNGKTTLGKAIHTSLASSANKPLALSIDVGGATDAKTIYGRMLDALGSPARISHRLNDRELILTHILHGQRIRLLILDELQDILSGNEREQQKVLMCIRYLMNTMHLQVLGLGTENAFQALTANKHLATRFRECVLPKWQADTTLARFLASYERHLPFPAPSNLSSAPVVKLLAKVGRGAIGDIVERIRNAAFWALYENQPSISIDLLEKAELPPAVCLFGDEA